MPLTTLHQGIGQTEVHKVMHFSASVGLERLNALGTNIRAFCA